MEHDSHDNHPYRERVHSTVRLAALIVRPRAAAGGVMEVLRGTLVRQRGVRNVLNVVLKSSTAAGWSVEEAGASTAEADAAKVLLFDQAFMKAEDVPSGPLTFITLAQMSSATTCPAQLREKLAQPEKNAAAGSSKRAAPWSADAVEVALSTHTVELTYKNYTMPELLQLVLPREVEMPAKTNTKTRASTGASSSSPQTTTNNNNTSTTTKALVALSGFEQVGHIAHVNLSDAHVPYQGTIGQVILDCNPSVDVVVNKVESISSVFREFKMEVIAQRHTIPRPPKDEACEASSTAAHEDQKSLEEQQRDELLTATVRQHGCMFRVPYNRVYWNSRLSHEHTRLVELLREGDVLFDVMAGVGPFSVPAAKNGHQVFANDLNPAAAEAMRRNCLLNKIDPMRLMVYNMDGRCFLNQTVYDHVMGLQVGQQKGVYECRGRRHVVLNLPAIAVEFLDVFSPAYARTTPDGRSPWTTRPPEASQVDRSFLIHVYCFSAAADLLGDAVKQVEASIGYTLPEANIENVHLVRDVAPTKRMICVSFTLPPAFWYRQRSRREPRGEDGSDYDDVSAEESTDGAEKKSTTMEPPRQRHCAE